MLHLVACRKIILFENISVTCTILYFLYNKIIDLIRYILMSSNLGTTGILLQYSEISF